MTNTLDGINNRFNIKEEKILELKTQQQKSKII